MFLRTILLLLISSNICFATDLQNLPSPYNTLEELLPFKQHGWYFNAKQMHRLLKNTSAKVVIEVGSWLGTSTRHIAMLLPENGVVYAVDHWQGSPEHQEGQPGWIPELSFLYEQFLSNVIHANLTHKIVPIRMSSLEAARELAYVKPDVIYIDAAHDTQSVYEDLMAWFPYVQNHQGTLCGDDWSWESVRIAVETFAKQFNLQIHSSGNFWRLEEKN